MKSIERRARENATDAAGRTDRGRGRNFMSERPLVWSFIATLGVLLGLALAWTLLSLSGVLFSVFAATFITLGLDPLVRWFQRRGMKRGVAILTVIILFILVIAGMLWLVLPLVITQSAALIETLPPMLRQPAARSSGSRTRRRARAACSRSIYTWFVGFISDPNTWATIGGGALNVGLAIVGGISTGFFIFILTIYFIATLDSSKAAIYTLISASHRERVVGYAERIMQNVGRYLSGMVILAFFNATFSFIVLLIAQVPFALVIAVAAFFITLIPLIGTVLTTIVMTVLALFVSPLSAHHRARRDARLHAGRGVHPHAEGHVARRCRCPARSCSSRPSRAARSPACPARSSRSRWRPASCSSSRKWSCRRRRAPSDPASSARRDGASARVAGSATSAPQRSIHSGMPCALERAELRDELGHRHRAAATCAGTAPG